MSAPMHRILDASFNRAAEGLRVVEDFARFVLEDRHLSREVKELRHALAAAVAVSPLARRYAARDTAGGVLPTISTPAELARTDAWHVCKASCERVKQSLRSLEEYGKCFDSLASETIESLRYRFYVVEAALRRSVDAAERLADVRLMVLIEGGATRQEFFAMLNPLLAAGVDAIQLREKRLADRELLDRAQLLVAATRGAQAPRRTLAIVNDRPDVAAAVDADGVHLGQDDLPVASARAILGPHKLIGVSTHELDQARRAVLDGADYLGAGPTFPSTTKSFDVFAGLEYLRAVAAEISLPAFAIGGIAPENASQVRETGVARIAVSGAVTKASDPRAAVERLRTAWGD